ncbi:MAG: type II toxin-antitoxin system VapC family toxin [Kiritimatiellia bacterium]
MKYLLDTHCFLWWFTEPERLSANTSAVIRNQKNQIYLSAASSWEISIKHRLGKLPLPIAPFEYVISRMNSCDFAHLPINHQHALLAGSLPLHHHDPFDRMLIAQAVFEKMTLITVDSKIQLYDVDILS